MADQERNPVDDLVDLLVYAPVGLLYEYEDVLPQLVKRGKSQVQLARVIGKMALSRGGGAAPANLVAETLARMLAERITEIGASIGLAPPADDPDDQPGDDAGEAAPTAPESESGSGSGRGSAPDPAGDDRPLPIAAYDTLTAREIIGLLDELDGGQLARIRAHEEANRARKTVLGKLDRLQA